MSKGIKIPFSCAFIEFLASYDNANNFPIFFFSKIIKHVATHESSANFLRKKSRYVQYVLEVMLTRDDGVNRNQMSSSADNGIVGLNFRYRNAESKNIIFALEISKDNHVSDLESELAM